MRILLGLVTLLATWVLVGMWLGDGWVAVADGVAVAVGGAVALTVWPPLVRQANVLFGRVEVARPGRTGAPVLDARSTLVAAVRDSIESGHDDT